MDKIFNSAVLRVDSPFFPTVNMTASQVLDRNSFFGLFSEVYANSFGYLKEIDDDELVNRVIAFDTMMVELDANEQLLVYELAVKSYLNGTDEYIKRLGLDSKRVDLGSYGRRIDTRQAVMLADYKRLETISKSTDVAIERLGNRVVELRAEIDIQRVDAAYVESEIAQKELQAAESELNLMRAKQRTLTIKMDTARISLRIAEASAKLAELDARSASIETQTAESVAKRTQLEAERIELDARTAELTVKLRNAEAEKAKAEYRLAESEVLVTEANSDASIAESETQRILAEIDKTNAEKQTVDAQIARVNTEIAQVVADIQRLKADQSRIDAEIEQTKLSVSDLAIVQAETAMETRRADEYFPAKLNVVKSREEAAGIEKQSWEMLVQKEVDVRDQLVSVVNNRYDMQIADVAFDKSADDAINGETGSRKALLDVKVSSAQSDATSEGVTIPGYQDQVYTQRRFVSTQSKLGAIANAERLAGAKIVNQLTHSIGGA